VNSAWKLLGTESSWKLLVPLAAPQTPCFQPGMPGCLESYGAWLLHGFLVLGVQMNVMLFLFNVFFPMYPMDGAKLIVCSMQLFCGASAKTAAKVLIGTSGPLAVLFIGYALKGMAGGGMMQGVMAYMGFMCIMETYKIYRLLKDNQLHQHPLFESARSPLRAVVDSAGVSQRLNDSSHDDEEQAAIKTQHTELRPFGGAGQALGGGPASTAAFAVEQPSRSQWLDRMERTAADRKKSVQQLEDERIRAGVE